MNNVLDLDIQSQSGLPSEEQEQRILKKNDVKSLQATQTIIKPRDGNLRHKYRERTFVGLRLGFTIPCAAAPRQRNLMRAQLYKSAWQESCSIGRSVYVHV